MPAPSMPSSDGFPVTPPRARRLSHPQETPPRQSTSGLPITPPSPVATPAMSRSWSIGSIPICFDGSSPKMMTDSPTFPASDSPQPHRSPQPFGYNEDERSSHIPASIHESPSAALRQRWKDRSSRAKLSGCAEELMLRGISPSHSDHPQVGLNIIGASPPAVVAAATSIRRSKASDIISSPQFLRVTVPDVDDASDNDDALSIFSISAYMRPDSACDMHGDDQHSKPADAEYQRHSVLHPSALSVSSSLETTTTESTEYSQGSRRSSVSHSPTNAASTPETPIVFSYPYPRPGISPAPTTSSEGELFKVDTRAAYSSRDSLVTKAPNPKRITLKQPFEPFVVQRPDIKDAGRTRSASSAGSVSTGTHSRRMSLISLPPAINFLKDTAVELHIDQVTRITSERPALSHALT